MIVCSGLVIVSSLPNKYYMKVPVYYRSRENAAQASEGLKKNIAGKQFRSNAHNTLHYKGFAVLMPACLKPKALHGLWNKFMAQFVFILSESVVSLPAISFVREIGSIMTPDTPTPAKRSFRNDSRDLDHIF